VIQLHKTGQSGLDSGNVQIQMRVFASRPAKMCTFFTHSINYAKSLSVKFRNIFLPNFAKLCLLNFAKYPPYLQDANETIKVGSNKERTVQIVLESVSGTIDKEQMQEKKIMEHKEQKTEHSGRCKRKEQ
jgi:hypothetical protein